MPLRLNGSTSGYSQIDAPAIAGDQTFTLPGTGGTLDRLNRAGNVVQVVTYQTGAYATGTTIMPADDTIPQNTEGDEYMSLQITPTNSNNKLLIVVNALLSNSANGQYMSGALFQDSTANALASFMNYEQTGTGNNTIHLQHYMTAGTTSATTFKFRAGGYVAGTTNFNGTNNSRRHGGVFSSNMTIWEIAA